jgi:hypothetical protein
MPFGSIVGNNGYDLAKTVAQGFENHVRSIRYICDRRPRTLICFDASSLNSCAKRWLLMHFLLCSNHRPEVSRIYWSVQLWLTGVYESLGDSHQRFQSAFLLAFFEGEPCCVFRASECAGNISKG